MTCRLAENPPLRALRADLRIQASCHSFRPECVHGLRGASSSHTLGAAGAILGYCQALFRRIGTPAENTRRVASLLSNIRAPWAYSHELFWGHRGSDNAEQFICSAFEPLKGIGRIPIVITPLRPHYDAAELNEIFAVSAPVEENEPVLVRIVLSDNKDVAALSEIVHRLLDDAAHVRRLPKWWPLVQGSIGLGEWQELQRRLGMRWKYLNIAVNPFMAAECRAFVDPQVTVCQIPVGTAEGVRTDGYVALPDSMPLSGRTVETGYNVVEYLRTFSKFDSSPTLLLLGPCLPNWSDDDNKSRIAAILPHVKNACDDLWGEIDAETRQLVWRMSA